MYNVNNKAQELKLEVLLKESKIGYGIYFLGNEKQITIEANVANKNFNVIISQRSSPEDCICDRVLSDLSTLDVENIIKRYFLRYEVNDAENLLLKIMLFLKSNV